MFSLCCFKKTPIFPIHFPVLKGCYHSGLMLETNHSFIQLVLDTEFSESLFGNYLQY